MKRPAEMSERCLKALCTSPGGHKDKVPEFERHVQDTTPDAQAADEPMNNAVSLTSVSAWIFI